VTDHDLDMLRDVVASLQDWGDTIPAHTMAHLENLIDNLRADLAVARHERDALKVEATRLKRHLALIETAQWENGEPMNHEGARSLAHNTLAESRKGTET